MRVPFRVSWAAFWWGVLHPFASDKEQWMAAKTIAKKYAHLFED